MFAYTLIIFNGRSSTVVLRDVGKQTICSESDSEDECHEKEIVKFEHACILCNHVVAKHLYEFWIEDGYQEYRMECLLCGQAQDSISLMPKDPRKMAANN